MDLAGNMVSTPVLMAYLLAAICAVSWKDPALPLVSQEETGDAVGRPNGQHT